MTSSAGSVQILRQVDAPNRYGQRDSAAGGDDWALPTAADLFEGYNGLTWGDFSNMNGGAFPPHSSHRTGEDGDGWFYGYNALDADTAEQMIDLLNRPEGSRIMAVGVTYDPVPGDPFHDAIKNVTLNDGRAADAVIRPWANHRTHFHWRLRSP